MITYSDETFCPHCKKETEHIFKHSGHERDSSYDSQECCACGWYRVGLDDYCAPSRDEDVIMEEC